MMHFFCILFTWVYPEGILKLCTEKEATAMFGIFFGLLQTFLTKIPSGVTGRGVSSLLPNLLGLWMRDFCCAGCRKQTLKSNTSCCYMFEKTHVISRDVTGRVCPV